MIPTFYVDGTPYTLPCTIIRKTEKRIGDNAGYLMNKHFHNDVLGTYITYTVTLAVPRGKESEYSNLYTFLAMPHGEYTFQMPYNQSFITFNGKVDNISDRLRAQIDDNGTAVNIWTEISLDITSTDPIQGATSV